MAILEMNSVLFEDINERLQGYLHNPFLRDLDIVPSASPFHFDVASAVLRIAGVPTETARDVLTAVLLLQRGLSIHDDIDDEEGRRRQLFVLTGDFGSSQYFNVLARLGDGPLLYALCDAVVKVNEAKMSLLDLPSDVPAIRQAQYYDVIEGQLLYALVNRYMEEPDYWFVQIQSLVQGYILKEVPSLSGMKNLPFRQGYQWLADIVDRLVKTQKNAVLAPISAFFVDYLRTIQSNFERHMTLSEGNS